jgi:HD-GYP domain-containing protein (c-di-GMP phosphodiesterase class II)
MPRAPDDELTRLRGALADTERRSAEKDRQLQRYAAELAESLERERARARELTESYAATVRALAGAVEARDAYTGGHAERVTAYGLAIAAAAGLELAERPEIEFGFVLHDIGKIAIPDAVLFKPMPLTTAETRLMQQHPVIGWDLVRDIAFLGDGRAVIRSHHERWDGGGYPDGLAGEQIPLAARVFAVADALDALTTDRPYRPAASFPRARALIRGGAGSQFDPAAVAALDAIPDRRLLEIRTPRAG